MSFTPEFFDSVVKGPSQRVPVDQTVVMVVLGVATAAAGAAYALLHRVRGQTGMAGPRGG
jgi:hypothetical protein